jgi:hypothetical protein
MPIRLFQVIVVAVTILENGAVNALFFVGAGDPLLNREKAL